MLVCAIVRIMLSTTCEETTIWVAILSSTVGYILNSAKQQLRVLVFERPNPPCFVGKQI